MRFIGLEIAGWEALFLSRVMSRTNVRNLIPHRQALTEHIRNQDHTVHACENRLCPISCQFCKRLCSGDHLHGLSADENHLCGYAHFFISPQCYSPVPPVKNTRVMPYVPLTGYAISIQRRCPLKLRSLEGMRIFSIPR